MKKCVNIFVVGYWIVFIILIIDVNDTEFILIQMVYVWIIAIRTVVEH